MSNRVEILLSARDNISGTIRGIKGNIASGIGSAVATVATLTASITLAGVAFAGLGSGFSKAADLQTAAVTNAYSLATVIGSTVSEAKQVTKDLTVQMTALGNTLPGVTEDYQKFANAIGTTVAFGSGGSMEKYKKDLIELSKVGGLLSVTGAADATQGAGALNKFLSGGMSMSEAFATSDLFQKNQDFKVYLGKAQSDLGLAGKDFQRGLSNAQRAAVVTLAGSMKFSPEMLAAYGETADTQLQAIKSKLFNPMTGIFGFARTMKGLDGRSALDAVATFMGQVDKLGTTAGAWLSTHGINLDPMEAIGHFMDTASGWAAGFEALIKGDKSGLNSMLKELRRGITSIKVEDFTGAVNTAMSMLTAVISSIDWGVLGSDLGNLVNRALKTFDWQGAGNLIDKALDGFIKSITSFVDSMALKDANKLLNKATGGVLGDKGDGSKSGYQRWLDQNGKDYDNSPLGGFINKTVRPAFGDNSKRDLQSALPALNQMSNNSRTQGNFAPQINIQGGTADSMQKTADYVLSAINNQYKQYRDAALV